LLNTPVATAVIRTMFPMQQVQVSTTTKTEMEVEVAITEDLELSDLAKMMRTPGLLFRYEEEVGNLCPC